MRADTLRGQVGGGWALEMESFLGPVKWHWADRRVPFGAQKYWFIDLMRWKTEIFPIYCMLLLNHIKNLNCHLFSNMEVIVKKSLLTVPLKRRDQGICDFPLFWPSVRCEISLICAALFFCFTWKILIFSFSDGPVSIEASDPSIAPLSPKVTNFAFSPRCPSLPVLPDVLGLLIIVKGATLLCPWLKSSDLWRFGVFCISFFLFVPHDFLPPSVFCDSWQATRYPGAHIVPFHFVPGPVL